MTNIIIAERQFAGPDAWIEFAKASDWRIGESVVINGQRYICTQAADGINRFELPKIQ